MFRTVITSLILFPMCAMALTTDSAMDSNVQQNFQELADAIRALKNRVAQLEARVQFLEENSPEAKQARAAMAERAAADAAARAASAEVTRKANHSISNVSDNGQYLTMAGGLVLLVHDRSRAYVRRWKPGQTVEERQQQTGAGAGWFWIVNAAAAKSEESALVKIME